MKITVNFKIKYITKWGESLKIIVSSSPKFDKDIMDVGCRTNDGVIWIAKFEISSGQKIYYKYQLSIGAMVKEEEIKIEPRYIVADDYNMSKSIFVQDHWRSPYDGRNIYFSAAFRDSIFKRDTKIQANEIGKTSNVFNLNAIDIPNHTYVGLVGNTPALGNWSRVNKMHFDGRKWSIVIDQDEQTFQYKYVLVNLSTGRVERWEEGENRTLVNDTGGVPFIMNDEGFRFGENWWRGSGLAIPVFSMRSKMGYGIGEFTDLRLMIDLAKEMKMNFLQTLPVNDTIANKSWTDSYPYAAISIYALHPLYIHIPSITDITKYDWYEQYLQRQQKLNDLSVIDFEEVLEDKTRYTKSIYDKEGKVFLLKKEVRAFIAQNEWVRSYAVFCHLRDINNTPNFDIWEEYTKFDKSIIDQFWSGDKPKKEVGYYVFIQYHLDKQLKDARDYGRAEGVVLKGDLPIGIYRYSCDAWINPELFNMDQQAGAPPDDYAVNGQNWGFPTYNWDEMSKDQFSWWRSRMTQLSNYFDALRIDHILGFFRIWSIPTNQASGTLGMFNPRLPFHKDELRARGLTGDLLRYTQPYIRTALLNKLFGDLAQDIVQLLLDEVWSGAYTFKQHLKTQMDFLQAIEDGKMTPLAAVKEGVLSLYTEVIFIEEPSSNFIYFNPRITLQTTMSYRDLDDHNKSVVDSLYNEYFFQRHSEYWKEQALWKLPALLNSTNMFICGEDLGMIPSTVPQVMKQLNIIPLEIQRMPKGNEHYGVCKKYDYNTVCSPSCHDMSTIRGWWEASYDLAKDYYRNYMGRYDDVPAHCTTEIVEYIIQDHLHSPSMLAIFPIQDILGIDYDLRMDNPHVEQINVPANPKHYWRYRLHINIEDLISNKKFCDRVASLVKNSGRA